MILEPSFVSKVAELTCENPEFERFLLRTRCSDAMFLINTVHGIDLMYHTPGNKC